MTILAHLVSRIDALDGEPAATQALAYLLRAEAPAEAFVRILEPAGLASFDVGTVDAERQLPDTTQPDLTVCDGDGHLRLLVENKFWATLTDAQPTRYLDFLPETPRSAVLFVVPEARRKVLWTMLQDRLAPGPHRLKDRQTTQTLTWGRVGTRTLAVTGWRHVLDTISAAAPDCTIWRCDLDQLRGLVEAREDAETFLPLRDEEVRATDVAQRIRNYTYLSPAIVDALVTENLATEPTPRPRRARLGGPIPDSTGRIQSVVGRPLRLLEPMGPHPDLGHARQPRRRLRYPQPASGGRACVQRVAGR